ncbi:hypothetical protein BDN70DRAFT_845351, partial [Pholiota conissans]
MADQQFLQLWCPMISRNIPRDVCAQHSLPIKSGMLLLFFLISYTHAFIPLLSPRKMTHVRTSNNDPRQGTMFSELVLFPTLRPDL